jgi:hypothetical protein
MMIQPTRVVIDPRHQVRVGLNLALVFFTCGAWLFPWAVIEIIRALRK